MYKIKLSIFNVLLNNTQKSLSEPITHEHETPAVTEGENKTDGNSRQADSEIIETSPDLSARDASNATNQEHTVETRLCSNQERLEQVRATCDSTDDWRRAKTFHRFVVDDRRKLLYCSVSKGGCTLLTALLQAANTHHIYPLTHVRDVHNPAAFRRANLRLVTSYNKNFDNYTKFLVVRNPVDRAMSAYHNVQVGLKNLGPEEYVYNALNNVFPGCSSQPGDMADRLTLEQYMTFLTEPELTKEIVFEDRHFSPIFQTCDPCRIQYDHLLRLETFDTDVQSLYSFLKLSPEFINKIPKSMNQAKGSQQGDKNATGADLLFSSASHDRIDKFLQRFAFDFSMFGYKYNQTSSRSSCELGEKQTRCC